MRIRLPGSCRQQNILLLLYEKLVMPLDKTVQDNWLPPAVHRRPSAPHWITLTARYQQQY
jgi:hypothetical protein